MEKILKLTILISFFYSCNNSVSKDSDWFKDGLKGKVNSVKSNAYQVVYEFGKLKKGEEDYSSDFSNNSNSSEFIYNYKGNLVEKIFFKTNPFDRSIYIKNKYTYLYDEKGNREKKFSYSSHGRDKNVVFNTELKTILKNVNTEMIYTYDDSGNKIKETEWTRIKDDLDLSSYCSSISTYKYNTLNDIEEEIYFNDYCEGATIETRVVFKYKYDGKGNVIQIKEKTMPQKDTSFGFTKAIYSNFSDGYIAKITNFDSSGNEITTIDFIPSWYTLDGNDISQNPENYVVTLKIDKKMKKFDKFNNVTELNFKDSEGEVIVYNYEYKYDKYNNWTEKVIYKDDTPKVIVERELVYF